MSSSLLCSPLGLQLGVEHLLRLRLLHRRVHVVQVFIRLNEDDGRAVWRECGC
jgi:hypothetical protein